MSRAIDFVSCVSPPVSRLTQEQCTQVPKMIVRMNAEGRFDTIAQIEAGEID